MKSATPIEALPLATTMNMSKAYRAIACMVMTTVVAVTMHATLLPPPEPDRFVYDYVGVMGSDASRINRVLVNFSKQTSNQIAVVIVDTLQGLEPAEFAYTLGDEWGVGSSGHDNGVVILIKPKTGDTYEGKGQVFIATGRGLEGAIPDIYCHQIVEQQMMPRLKENDYDGAVNIATVTLMNAAKGEYDEALMDGDARGDSGDLWLGFIILGLIFGGIFVFALLGNIHPRNKASALDSRTMSSHGIIDWNGVFRDMGNITLNLLLLLLSSSGGSGRSGGSSSGHGFGGGSFGGGGAGGSW